MTPILKMRRNPKPPREKKRELMSNQERVAKDNTSIKVEIKKKKSLMVTALVDLELPTTFS
jgi:hypothetical protein